METTIQTDLPMIERVISNMVVPHEKDKIVFVYPPYGPSPYMVVGRQILKSGQQVPRGDHIASLLHATYCAPKVENEPEFKNVREIMENLGLWAFNINLWTSEGVYVHNLDGFGETHDLNKSDLEKKLKGGKELNGIRFSEDGRIRFAPKGSYKPGIHKPESLAKDGFVIAGFGFEGAEKLGEVSANFGYNSGTSGVEVEEGDYANVQEGQFPWLFVSKLHLSRCGGLGIPTGNRLEISGQAFRGELIYRGVGHAFGVLK